MLRFLVLLSVVAAGCSSDETPAPTVSGPAPLAARLVVEDVAVRPAPAGGVSAAFLRIVNGADTADTLVAARADASADVQLHRTTGGPDGMRRMERISSLPVPASETVVLEPGDVHVMLIGLDWDLVVGDTVSLDLDFARQGTVSLRAPVRPPVP